MDQMTKDGLNTFAFAVIDQLQKTSHICALVLWFHIQKGKANIEEHLEERINITANNINNHFPQRNTTIN